MKSANKAGWARYQAVGAPTSPMPHNPTLSDSAVEKMYQRKVMVGGQPVKVPNTDSVNYSIGARVADMMPKGGFKGGVK